MCLPDQEISHVIVRMPVTSNPRVFSGVPSNSKEPRDIYNFQNSKFPEHTTLCLVWRDNVIGVVIRRYLDASTCVGTFPH